MKTIKPIILTVLGVLLAVSCEMNQNFQQIVDAPSTLVYVAEAGLETPQSSSIVLLPDGFITLDKFYQVNVNTSRHPAATATLSVSEADLAAFNAAKGTSYPLLPAEYLSISTYVKPAPVTPSEGEDTPAPEAVEEPFVPSGSATVHIRADERLSDESVRFRLGGHLENLTEEYYLVPLRLECSELDLSQKRNVLYMLVNLTDRLIKPVESQDDIDGSLVTARTGWTASSADGITNLANIFTSSNTQGATFPSEDPLTFTVDMKATHQVTGIKLLTIYASYGYSDVQPYSIAYSTDGENFVEMDVDPETDVFFGSDQGANIGFYVPIEMQYIRITAVVRSTVGANYRRLVQFYIYE